MRRPGLAAWLSLLPGLGQLYNRQPLKALTFLLGVPAFFLASFGVPALTTELLRWWRPRGSLAVSVSVILQLVSLLVFIGFFLGGLLFWYAAAHDARITARERAGGRPARGRWWLFHR